MKDTLDAYAYRELQESGHREAGPLIDPLTGAYTLEYLARQLEGEMARSRRHGHSLSVLHCEIGHTAIEPAPRDFARRLAACIRKEDWLVRVGSTAFKIVLPETNTVGAECAARKIHDRFADLPSLRIDMLALEPHRRPADATALFAGRRFEEEVIRRSAAGRSESHFTRFLHALTAAADARGVPPSS